MVGFEGGEAAPAFRGEVLVFLLEGGMYVFRTCADYGDVEGVFGRGHGGVRHSVLLECPLE